MSKVNFNKRIVGTKKAIYIVQISSPRGEGQDRITLGSAMMVQLYRPTLPQLRS